MKRFTVKCVDADEKLFNILDTNNHDKALEAENKLREAGFEAWTCDNLNEFMAG